MDWLTFISNIFDSTAWPLVVILAVLALKKPLSNLISNLRRLRWKDFEAEFGREVSVLRNAINREISPTVLSPPGTDEFYNFAYSTIDEFSNLAKLSPRSVVLESWRQVESAARDAASYHNIPQDKIRSLPPVVLGRLLAKAGILDSNQIRFYNDLRNLRNKAAHADEFSFSKEDALEYADLAKVVAQDIRRVGI